jgi:hypothetical protein
MRVFLIRLLAFPIGMTTWSGHSHLNRMIFAEKFYHDTLFTLFILFLPLHGMCDIDMFSQALVLTETENMSCVADS